MSIQVSIVVTCPSCAQSLKMDNKKVPAGRLKVVCRRCCTQFPLDRTSGLNCKIQTVGNVTPMGEQPKVSAEGKSEWMVDARLCKGYKYDITGLATLIRSGIVNKNTRLRHINGSTVVAGSLPALKVYFNDKSMGVPEERVAGSLSDGVPDTRPFSEQYTSSLDYSDFFNEKILPFLSETPSETSAEKRA